MTCSQLVRAGQVVGKQHIQRGQVAVLAQAGVYFEVEVGIELLLTPRASTSERLEATRLWVAKILPRPASRRSPRRDSAN